MKRSILSVLMLTVLCACAPAIQSSEMLPLSSVYNNISANEKLTNAIELGDVKVLEGKGGSMSGKITGPQFKEALNNALLMAGFAKRGDDEAKYVLNASVIDMDYPLLGFSMKVTSKIDYKLNDKASNELVYGETIVLPYTAEFGEAFNGNQRLRIATAKAVRENITHLIRVLAQKEFE